MAAGILVGNGAVGRPSRGIADVDVTGWGGGLDASGGVDQVSGDHAFALGAKGYRSFSRQDTRSRTQVVCPYFLPECRNPRREIERGSYGAFGVVLGRSRRAPHRHHRVADELLHRSAVARDQGPRRFEVTRQEFAHFF